MAQLTTKVSVFVLLLLIQLPYTVADSNYKFRTWYDQYRDIFNRILDTSCAEQYNAYQDGNATFAGAEPIGDGTGTPGEAVVQCILNSTSEFIKANMASAGIILGIMPFALSVLGTDSEESALLCVISGRPLLTLLVLAGAPVVTALQPFEYKDPVMHILASREPRFHSLNLRPQWAVLVLEYVIALLAVANIAHTTYQVCSSVVTMILPDALYLPALWAGGGILVHLLGAACLASRLRVQPLEDRESLFRSEFSLSSTKKKKVETLGETRLFLALSWFVSTASTFHVIFGTVTFSSVQFISVRDAFGVFGRFAASVTACRIVVMYELSGLQQATRTVQDPDGAVSPSAIQHPEMLPYNSSGGAVVAIRGKSNNN